MAIVTLADVQTYLAWDSTTQEPADDAVLTMVHTESEKLIKQYVGYDIEQDSYVEFYPAASDLIGTDSLVVGFDYGPQGAMPVTLGFEEGRRLYVKQRPIREIVSIHENPNAWRTAGGDFSSAYLLSEGTHFYVDWEEEEKASSGLIIRHSSAWSRVRRSIRVAYTAGYETAELSESRYPFRSAVLSTVQVNFAQALTLRKKKGEPVGMVAGESLAGWSIQFDTVGQLALLGFRMMIPASVQQMLSEFVSVGGRI